MATIEDVLLSVALKFVLLMGLKIVEIDIKNSDALKFTHHRKQKHFLSKIWRKKSHQSPMPNVFANDNHLMASLLAYGSSLCTTFPVSQWLFLCLALRLQLQGQPQNRKTLNFPHCIPIFIPLQETITKHGNTLMESVNLFLFYC
jgi:hypothetical protein